MILFVASRVENSQGVAAPPAARGETTRQLAGRGQADTGSAWLAVDSAAAAAGSPAVYW